MDKIVEISELFKSYNKCDFFANKNINLEICKGEVFGLLGPNGSGKTTLVRQICGLLKPTSGRILINGVDIGKKPTVIPDFVSYFGQKMYVLNNHKVWEAVYYTGIFRGLSCKEAKKQTDFLINLFNMQNCRNKVMSNISGGQIKLVGLMSALIGLRPILILDEPTNDLDPKNRRLVWDTLTSIKENFNIAIFLVTHNIYEAEKVLDKVAIMDKGEIIASGTPAELKGSFDDFIRIEVFTKDPVCYEDINLSLSYEILNPKRLRVTVNKIDIDSAISEIFQTINMKMVEDIKIITASLEDVYISKGGSSHGID